MTVSVRWRALVLVDADRSSLAAASTRHGVAASTITKWRRSLTTDPELAGFYADETRRAMGRYRADFSATLSCALARLRELIPQTTIGDLKPLLDIAVECGGIVVQADALIPDHEKRARPSTSTTRTTEAADGGDDDKRH